MQVLIKLPESDTLKNIAAITLSILALVIVVILCVKFLGNNKKIEEIRIAGGPSGMIFNNIANGLKSALSKDNDVKDFVNPDKIIVETTEGSQNNLTLVCSGKVDLALIEVWQL